MLRKGCNDNCVLRPCLQWIESADAQGNATVFVAKFFGRAGLMGFIAAVPEDQRAALFQSLLYEACGRTVNPVHGALGLLWSGNWNVCEAAVDTVLKGGSLKPPAQATPPLHAVPASAPGTAHSPPPAAAAAAAAAAALRATAAAAGGGGPLVAPQQQMLERPAARSSPRLSNNSHRARSSFTAAAGAANGDDQPQPQLLHQLPQQQQLYRHRVVAVAPPFAGGGLGGPAGPAVHELDNASEISSAGTGAAGTSRLMAMELAAEELRRRDGGMRSAAFATASTDYLEQQRQARHGGPSFNSGQGMENGEWRTPPPPPQQHQHVPLVSVCVPDRDQDHGSDADLARRTWHDNTTTACNIPGGGGGGFWSGQALIRDDLTRRLALQQQQLQVQQQQQGFHPRVKREHCDIMSDNLQQHQPRRVQARLADPPHSASLAKEEEEEQAAACVEHHDSASAAAAPWDASETEARGSSRNAGGGAKLASHHQPVELSLTLNSCFASAAKEQQQQHVQQQQRKGCGGGVGVRVSSPSCGSVNSEGSVTSLHSCKPAASWTLQLASESQSNRQLLPLLR